MPRYPFQCRNEECGACLSVFRSVDERDNAPHCPDCRNPMFRIFSPPYLTTETFLDHPANKDALKFFDAKRAASEGRYAARYQ